MLNHESKKIDIHSICLGGIPPVPLGHVVGLGWQDYLLGETLLSGGRGLNV